MAETLYPQSVPSPADIAKFGQTLARHGFVDAGPKLTELVAFVREAQSVDPVSNRQAVDAAKATGSPQAPVLVDELVLAELLSEQAPDVVRYRAFAVLSARWDQVVASLAERRNAQFDWALQELLAAWNQHQDLRKSSTEIQALFDSRQQLDHLRFDVANRRKARV